MLLQGIAFWSHPVSFRIQWIFTAVRVVRVQVITGQNSGRLPFTIQSIIVATANILIPLEFVLHTLYQITGSVIFLQSVNFKKHIMGANY